MSTATSAPTQPTLISLLRGSGAAIRLFDMGRRINKLSAEQFERIEQQHLPYPHPFLHQAWLGLLIWHPKHQQQNAIWFLKLPLDEQGYLVQAARDDLVARLLQNALASQQGLMREDALKDNPFAFKPDQEKMAVFHALAAQATGQCASSWYEEAQRYLHGQLEASHWTQLALQGLADFVVRLEQAGNAEALVERIAQLPAQPLASIATLLEHVTPPRPVAEALAQRLARALSEPDTSAALVAALLRGLSNAADEPFKQRQVLQVLATDYALDAEVIVAIATRCTSTLQAPEVLLPFLERLAQGGAGQAGFSRVLADLMFMPALRALIMQALRNPQRSERLSAAIGEMFGQGFSRPH